MAGIAVGVGLAGTLYKSLSSFGGVFKPKQISTIPEVANVASTPLQLSETLAIVVAAEIVQDCAYSNDPNCSVGFPIQVYGSASHEDHANHIFEAQIGFGNTFSGENIGNPGFPSEPNLLGTPIPAFLSRNTFSWNRGWLDQTRWCNNIARGDYLDTTGS